MSTSDYRKCSKCGKTRAENKVVTYHRFPKPGKNNIMKALAWAKYCWPDEEWTHETLVKLNTASKVLCGRHFASSQFYDDKRQKLSKFAVPDAANVENLLKERDNILKEKVIVDLPNVDREAAGPSIPVTKEALAPTPVTGNDKSSFSKAVEDEYSLWRDSAGDPNESEVTNPSEEVQFLREEDCDVAPCNDDSSAEVPNPTREVQFSWEQDSAVVPCDDGAELSPAPTPPRSPPRDESPVLDHTLYKCNFCCETITGFRYTCVQCLDVDLCGACEARQAHHMHYVLRIPHNRPQAEVSARLRAIRRALLADAIVNVTGDALDADDVEVKDEPSQEDVEMSLEDIESAQTETIHVDDQDDPLNMDQSQENSVEMESDLEESIDVESDLEESIDIESGLEESIDIESALEESIDADSNHEDLEVELLVRTDGGTIDRSPEDSSRQQMDLQLKPIQHKSKLTTTLPSNTHPVQTQSKSSPVVKLTSLKTLPIIPQKVFTTQERQSKLNTDLRVKPTATINTNKAAVTLGKVKLKPIILRNRKEQKERLLKMLNRSNISTRQQAELLEGSPKITRQPMLESSSTENKRATEIDFWPIVKVKKLGS